MNNKSLPSKNYEFFVKTDTSKYTGEWIAIVDEKIVAHGSAADQVYKQAQKKNPGKTVSLAKTPKRQFMVLQFSP